MKSGDLALNGNDWINAMDKVEGCKTSGSFGGDLICP